MSRRKRDFVQYIRGVFSRDSDTEKDVAKCITCEHFTPFGSPIPFECESCRYHFPKKDKDYKKRFSNYKELETVKTYSANGTQYTTTTNSEPFSDVCRNEVTKSEKGTSFEEYYLNKFKAEDRCVIFNANGHKCAEGCWCTERDQYNYEIREQEAKHDKGKLQLTLVPTTIIKAIADIRMYGCEKYGDPNNWKKVSKERYRDAAYRHFLTYIEDPTSIDAESGLPTLWHLACNIAFLCEMEGYEREDEWK